MSARTRQPRYEVTAFDGDTRAAMYLLGSSHHSLRRSASTRADADRIAHEWMRATPAKTSVRDASGRVSGHACMGLAVAVRIEERDARFGDRTVARWVPVWDASARAFVWVTSDEWQRREDERRANEPPSELEAIGFRFRT